MHHFLFLLWVHEQKKEILADYQIQVLHPNIFLQMFVAILLTLVTHLPPQDRLRCAWVDAQIQILVRAVVFVTFPHGN